LQAIDFRSHHIRSKKSEIQSHLFAAWDFKTVVDEARQFPMMANHRVVIIKEAQDMRSLKNLAAYAENPSPQSIVVINHKYKKFDSRTKLAKAIKARSE